MYYSDNRIIYVYNCKSYQYLGPQTLAYTVPYGKTKSIAKKLEKAKNGKEKKEKKSCRPVCELDPVNTYLYNNFQYIFTS